MLGGWGAGIALLPDAGGGGVSDGLALSPSLPLTLWCSGALLLSDCNQSVSGLHQSLQHL